jgi:hypothetical protein
MNPRFETLLCIIVARIQTELGKDYHTVGRVKNAAGLLEIAD